MFLAHNLMDAKYATNFLIRCVKLRKIACQEMVSSIFRYMLELFLSNGASVWFVEVAY